MSSPPREDTATRSHARPQIGETRLGVIRAGDRYAFGYGPDFYGIWDEAAPGNQVTERFDPTARGRQEAWARFQDLEPSAKSIEPTAVGFVKPPEPEVVSHRGRWVFLSLVVVVAVIVGIMVARGGGGTTNGAGGGGGVSADSKAHVDLSGSITQSEDLQGDSLQADLGGLYGTVVATWKGPNITMNLSMNVPTSGDNRTNENPHRTLGFDITTTDGTQVQFTSVRGECLVHFNTLETGNIAGTFDCTGLTPAGSDQPFDAKGTFDAASS